MKAWFGKEAVLPDALPCVALGTIPADTIRDICSLTFSHSHITTSIASDIVWYLAIFNFFSVQLLNTNIMITLNSPFLLQVNGAVSCMLWFLVSHQNSLVLAEAETFFLLYCLMWSGKNRRQRAFSPNPRCSIVLETPRYQVRWAGLV